MTIYHKLVHFFAWVALKSNVEPHELQAMMEFFNGTRGCGELNNEQIKEYLTDNQIDFAKRIYEKYIDKEA